MGRVFPVPPSGETFDEVAKKRREENARISLTPEHEIGDSQIVDHFDAPRALL
jgi:hypothetical protein